jgi:fumarate hydratase class II
MGAHVKTLVLSSSAAIGSQTDGAVVWIGTWSSWLSAASCASAMRALRRIAPSLRAVRRASTRVERDTMGEIAVPAEALFGATTARAVQNFQASGIRLPRHALCALGHIKASAARANGELGLLPPHVAAAIADAAERVASGELDAHFPVDVFQTGSGTSSNMNANEVIARLASEAIGERVHPNDAVNLGQSSNDVFPSAVHVAVAFALRDALLPSLRVLELVLRSAAARTWGVLKPGRTHLQDALPLRMGQVFLGHAEEVHSSARRLREACSHEACELPLGGTAVGTGFGSAPGFAAAVVLDLSRRTGLPLHQTSAHFKAQGSMDNLMHVSGCLNGCQLTLTRVANAVRWLGCGPRTGIAELTLPAVQPGSSMMPGKVNPVLAEALLQSCAHVAGGHQALTVAAATGAAFELHTAWPLAAHTLVQSCEVLAAATRAFAERCVAGTEATEKGPHDAARSLMCVTGLLPLVGYDRAAAVAKHAAATGRSICDAAVELCGDTMDAETLRRAVHPSSLLGPRDTPDPPVLQHGDDDDATA